MKLAWPPSMDAGDISGVSPDPAPHARNAESVEPAPDAGASLREAFAIKPAYHYDLLDARGRVETGPGNQSINPHEQHAEKLRRIYTDGNLRLRWSVGLAALALAMLLAYSGGPLIASLGWFGLALASQAMWFSISRSLRKKDNPALGGEPLKRYVAQAVFEGATWGALVFFWGHVAAIVQPILIIVPVLMALLTVNRYALIPVILERFLMATLLTLSIGVLYADVYMGAGLVLCLAVVWAGLRQEALRLVEDYGRQIHSRFNLEQQVDTDPLSGLLSRRGLEVALNREWLRAERTHSPLSLIMIDIDHFKKFNDRYGHLAGDACVKSIAGVLSSRVDRVGDYTARFSGEVFMVMLHHTAQADARALANKLRQGVLDLRIEHSDNPVGTVSISLGGVTLIPGEKHTPTTILQLVDQALHQAKMQGRNQVAWVTVFD